MSNANHFELLIYVGEDGDAPMASAAPAASASASAAVTTTSEDGLGELSSLQLEALAIVKCVHCPVLCVALWKVSLYHESPARVGIAAVIYNRWMAAELLATLIILLYLCREYMLPAMSLIGANVGAVSELWSCLKSLSWKVRYSLYATWRYVNFNESNLALHAYFGLPCYIPRADCVYAR